MQRKSILKSLARLVDRLLFYAFLIVAIGVEGLLLVYVPWLGAAIILSLVLVTGWYIVTDRRRQQRRAARERQSRVEQFKSLHQRPHRN